MTVKMWKSSVVKAKTSGPSNNFRLLFNMVATGRVDSSPLFFFLRQVDYLVILIIWSPRSKSFKSSKSYINLLSLESDCRRRNLSNLSNQTIYSVRFVRFVRFLPRQGHSFIQSPRSKSFKILFKIFPLVIPLVKFLFRFCEILRPIGRPVVILLVASLKIFQNLIQNLSVGDSSCQIFIQIFEETEMLKTRIDELSKEKANQQKEYRQLQLQYEKLEERFKSEKAISLKTYFTTIMIALLIVGFLLFFR